jgi:hypothetical protein
LVSLWLYLVLVHLIADFILQPYPLVRLKHRPLGLGIHAAIHAGLTALVLGPLIDRWWVVTLLVGVLHYVVDLAKIRSGYARGPASLAAFLLDQAVHLAALALVIPAAGVRAGADFTIGSPAVTAVLFYSIPYVTATFAGAILTYQVALAYQTRPEPEDLLRPRLRSLGYLERGILLTMMLFFAPILWVAAVAWYAGRLALLGRRRWVMLEVAAGGVLTVTLGLLFRP